MNYLLKNIPNDLYRKFKVLCAEQELTIKDKFMGFMEDEVEEREATNKKVRSKKEGGVK